MQLSLDRRETRLSNALLEFPHTRRDLPVGDVLCEYLDGRQTWVAERKTAGDLANSIKTGRWSLGGRMMSYYDDVPHCNDLC